MTAKTLAEVAPAFVELALQAAAQTDARAIEDGLIRPEDVGGYRLSVSGEH